MTELVSIINQNTWSTYDVGSNILDNIKHCVAMGGADDAGGAGGVEPIIFVDIAVAGAAAGFCAPMFKALAAYSGIWKPVPVTT